MAETVIAVNDKQLQESDFKEGYRVAVHTGFILVLYLLILAYTIFGCFIFILGLLVGKINFTALLILVIGVLFMICLPYLKGKQAYKQHLLMTAGGTIVKKTVFYEDHLNIIVGDAMVSRLDYSLVKKVAVTKNLYILCFPSRVFCFIRLDGFSVGSLEAVQKQVEANKKGSRR